ncbi:MAG: HD-like signal output (HDOD) protein [Desulforhopalus sp.]|jgi:HD-like signal output (HDOD) protein
MVAKSILFVDDEPNILSGLKRMLRPMRNEMDFEFAEGGRQALEIIKEKEVHVIVSDMRMPGMDGAALLTTVQESHPQIIRIMLTGQADDESVMRTVGVVHQFLAKPSDPNTLKEVLTRACALQELMMSAHLKGLVSSLGGLPSLPTVYKQVTEALKDPECAISDIAQLIEQDMAMSAKVLQLVNSAFFGLFKTIDSPGHAVNLLGLDTIKALVLGVGVFSEINSENHASFSAVSLWSHSVTTAAFAKKIAQAETDRKEVVDNSFIAGMIHDIGKLLLFSHAQPQFIEAVENAQETGMTLVECEQDIFSANHCDVGGYLIGLWGLPGPVIEAITFHHRLEDYPSATFSPAIAVHAADVIYYKLHPDLSIGAPPELNEEYLKLAGLEGRLEKWTELCQELLE